jgi:hypothetical protein
MDGIAIYNFPHALGVPFALGLLAAGNDPALVTGSLNPTT